MGKTIYTDIEIRGATYATVKEAAEAIGVKPYTVRKAIRNGTLDRVGAGLKGGPVPTPVRIRGVTYPDAKSAAAAVGVSLNAIYNALSEGRIDRVGLSPRYNGARDMPIAIGPLWFPSRIAASRALGFGDNYVSIASRDRSSSMWQRVIAAAMRLKARQEAEAMRAAQAAARKQGGAGKSAPESRMQA